MRPKKPESTRIGRPVPSAAGPHHQPEARTDTARRPRSIGTGSIAIAPFYSEKGRPGIPTRFAIGRLLLKHIYGLFDEGVCAQRAAF